MSISSMLYQSGMSVSSLSEVNRLERMILDGLDWCIQSSTLIEGVLGLCECLKVGVSDTWKCLLLSDFILFDFRIQEFCLGDVSKAIVRSVCGERFCSLKCCLSCRIRVEEDMRLIKERLWCYESEELLLQTYDSSLLSIFLNEL